MRSSRKRAVRWISSPSILTAFAVALAGCGDGSESNVGVADQRTFVTVTVKRQDMVIDVSATGEIEAIREIEIKSKASGKILRLPVEEGDAVNAGALLAQIDTADVALQLVTDH